MRSSPARLFQRSRQDKDRIDATHFGVDGNRLARLAAASKRARPARSDPVKPTAFASGCFTTAIGNFIARALQKGKDSGRHTGFFDCLRDCAGDQFSGRGVGGMALDDDRTACGKSGCRIAPRDGKCERKIACAENRHRSYGNQHPPNVRFWQRLAVRDTAINTGIHPGALSNKPGEHLQLINCAPALTCQPLRNWKCSFGICGCEQIVAKRFDLFSDALQKRCAALCGDLAHFVKGCIRCLEGHVDVGFGRLFKTCEMTARREMSPLSGAECIVLPAIMLLPCNPIRIPSVAY